MKVREGFVSNSSSSSFVVDKGYLTAKQIDHIKNHIGYSELKMWWDLGSVNEPNAWAIRETEGAIELSTFMDNFDMRHFLSRIEVPDEAIMGDGEEY